MWWVGSVKNPEQSASYPTFFSAQYGFVVGSLPHNGYGFAIFAIFAAFVTFTKLADQDEILVVVWWRPDFNPEPICVYRLSVVCLKGAANQRRELSEIWYYHVAHVSSLLQSSFSTRALSLSLPPFLKITVTNCKKQFRIISLALPWAQQWCQLHYSVVVSRDWKPSNLHELG